MYRAGRAGGKSIDTINLQNFENALMITRILKKFFPEKNPLKTSMGDQLGYVIITSKELVNILWQSALPTKDAHPKE
jgi:hypothetical protein